MVGGTPKAPECDGYLRGRVTASGEGASEGGGRSAARLLTEGATVPLRVHEGPEESAATAGNHSSHSDKDAKPTVTAISCRPNSSPKRGDVTPASSGRSSGKDLEIPFDHEEALVCCTGNIVAHTLLGMS